MGDIRRLAEDVGDLGLQLQHRIEGDVLPRFGRDRELTDIFLREEALRRTLKQPDAAAHRQEEGKQHQRLEAQAELQAGIVAGEQLVEALFQQAPERVLLMMLGIA